jgi:hypothetical protein
MTRHEQILSAVQKRFSSNDKHLVSKISTFIDGAKWADEHPKPDMVNKQEFIEKIWQWLKAHIKIETISYNDVWDVSEVEILATDFTTVDEMEESFRKAMEE